MKLQASSLKKGRDILGDIVTTRRLLRHRGNPIVSPVIMPSLKRGILMEC